MKVQLSMPVDGITMDNRYVQIDDDVAKVVSEINRLWPELRVQYAEQPELGEAPYRIVERCKDGVIRPVVNVWELDDRLLDLLHDSDSHRVDVLHIADAHNKKITSARVSAERDWREAAKDVLASRAASRLGRWSFPDPRPGHEGEKIISDNDPSKRTLVSD